MTKNSKIQQIEALSSLIKLSADISDIRNLINNLPTALQNVDNFERYLFSFKLKQILIITSYDVFSFPLFRWRLIDVITEKLADFPEEKETWRKSVVTAAIKCLIASYSNHKDQATSPSEQERSILERLCQHLVGFSYKHMHALVFISLICNFFKIIIIIIVVIQSSSEEITASEWNGFVKNGLK